LIANNFITQSIGQSSSDGIYLYGASYTDVYFNSILITGSTALYSGGGTTGINIINNILCNTGGGNAIYVSLTTPIVKCDYNDIYTTGSYFGHWGTSNASNFISWKNLTQKDSNSVSCDPQFISDTDLHASSSCIMNKGFPLLSVTDDIDNEPRSITQPTIGADEINIITGELESENKKNIGIFPNPSTGLININFAESTTENNVEIVNSIGEVILTKVISHQSSTTLDLSNHAKGIYFIKAQNGNGVVARKLIVE